MQANVSSPLRLALSRTSVPALEAGVAMGRGKNARFFLKQFSKTRCYYPSNGLFQVEKKNVQVAFHRFFDFRVSEVRD